MTQANQFDDTPMHRVTISEMSSNQLVLFIESLRERRLKPVRMYEEEVAAVKLVKDAQSREKLEKHLALLQKEFERIDRCLGSMEKRVFQIRTLRFELNLEE